MEQNYFGNRYSDKLLSPLISKILFNRVFHRSVLLLLLFYSVGSYSQETAISGLENIHISPGATIITETNEKDLLVITGSSKKICAKETNRDIGQRKTKSERKILNRTKVHIAGNKEKNSKASAKKVVLYSSNSTSNARFDLSNSSQKQATTSAGSPFKNVATFHFEMIAIQRYMYLEKLFSNDILLSTDFSKSFFCRPPPFAI